MLAPGLIVAFEDVGQCFAVDAVARILDHDANMSFTVCIHNQVNTSLVGIFDGIRQQIVKDGSDDF